MALDERQLAVVLQASVDRASELLRADGGFMPFGTRAKPSGEIEFVQIAPESETETFDALLSRLADMLAVEARQNAIIGSALVADVAEPSREAGRAIAVLVETPGFSRSILVPYRIGDNSVATGQMIPDEAVPTVFADPA
jgi:hypothetical protein